MNRWTTGSLAVVFFALAAGCATTHGAVPLDGNSPPLRAAAPENLRRLNALIQTRNRERSADEYQLASGDLVSITIHGYRPGGTDFATDVRIDDAGFASLPMIPPVLAGGRTSGQLRDGIANALRAADLMRRPQVSVFLKGYQGQRVLVLGAVARPGVYHLSRGQETLIDLLSMAGGLTPDAGNYIAFRPAGADRTAGGLEATYTLAGTSPESPAGNPIIIPIDQPGGTTNPALVGLRMHGGDLVVAPAAGQAFIEGEVANPGIYKLTHGMTLTQLLATAGGLLFPSNRSKISLVRGGASAGNARWLVDLDKIHDQKQPDVLLEPNDRIVVPGTAGKKVIYSVYEAINAIVRISVGGSLPIF